VIDTVQYGIKYIPTERYTHKTLIIDCDNFYNNDILRISREINNNCLFYKEDTHSSSLYSYITFSENGILKDIKEKEKISDYANIGVYLFIDIHTIKEFIKPYYKYISEIYKHMLEKNVKIHTSEFTDVSSMNSPLDITLFSHKHICRFCFDLDNTLVTYPEIPNDYTTVRPIPYNINFLKYLKRERHTIIIHTARRMKTHKGNTGSVLADIGKITFDTLQKFDIPFDEIHFGKPDADFYIDDKAVNCFSNLERETGFYDIFIPSRSFNTIKVVEDTIVKSSKNNKLRGEIYWYTNCPEDIKGLFPRFISGDTDSYVVEKINGVSMSYLFTQKNLTCELLDTIITSLQKIHISKSNTVFNGDIYELYKRKLKERYTHPVYSGLENADTIYRFLCQRYDEYSRAECGVIHGDPVLSNIMMDDKKDIKFIDMRGVVGETLTIYGDIYYDFAKLYQSLSGYDFVLKNLTIPIKYTRRLMNHMERYFSKDMWRWIRILSLGLYFTLLPLHDEDTSKRLYDHLLNMYEETV
jgi:capsule biosynthesis phosphatase